jgi:PTS system beta-glucosides-specific IIC component
MAKNCKVLADRIVEKVGGKENIDTVTHCATRLRFQLKDETKADTAALKKMDGVVTALSASGWYQVVIGNEVANVYDALIASTGLNAEKPLDINEDVPKEKKSAGKVFVDFMMSLIGPFMGPFTASGILKGLLVIATMLGLSKESGWYILLNAVSDAVFFFLPVFLGWTSAKKLKMNPYVGLLIGAILCYPAINGADLTFFGRTFNVTYTATFLPTVLITLFASPIYRWLDKKLPAVIRGFAAPLITLLIAIPVGFLIVGPFANRVAGIFASAVTWIYSVSPILTGILAGALWQVLVVFGMHTVLMTACMLNIVSGNGDMILAVSIIVCFCQAAVVLVMALRTKDRKFRDMALPTVVSGIFGVTEPAIYGITLPRIRYFIISCIGGAAAGLVCGIFGIKKYSFGSGIFALPTLIDVNNPNLLQIGIAILVGVGVSVILTLILYREKDIEIEK